jgi:hypothetical protein
MNKTYSIVCIHLTSTRLKPSARVAGGNVANIKPVAQRVYILWKAVGALQNINIVDPNRCPVADLDKEHGEGLLVRVPVGQKRGDISVVCHSNVAASLFVLGLECVDPDLIARGRRSVGCLSEALVDSYQPSNYV